MVRVVIAAVLLLLALPSAANADRLDRVNRLAVQMWGPVLTDVCPDGLTVRYERAQYDTLGWAWQNRCEIGLNSRRDALESWSGGSCRRSGCCPMTRSCSRPAAWSASGAA
jgi:hypothetical protein